MKQSRQSGEIMLEATMVLTVTLVVVLVMFSLLFWFYQYSALVTMTTELAEDTARNYKYVSGATNDDELSSKTRALTASPDRRYRSTLRRNKLENDCEPVLDAYAEKRFLLSSFGLSDEVKVSDLGIVYDGVGRAHVEVTVTLKTKVLFSSLLEYVGVLDEKETMTVVANADIQDYVSCNSQLDLMKYVKEKLNNTALGKISGSVRTILTYLKIIDN